MKRFILSRALGLIPVFFAITFLTFCVIRLSPGEPSGLEADSQLKLAAEAREKMTALYGLDKPVVVQYGAWLSRMVRFDFGTSFADGEAVNRKILRALPVTAGLNGLSLLLAFLAGTYLGLATALRAGSRLDRIVSAVCFGALSLPAFWIALLAVHLFGVELGWLPVTGLSSVFSNELPLSARFWDLARHLILPVLTSAFGFTVAVSRFARAAFLDVMNEPFVRNARAAGVPESEIHGKIILRNGLLPMITLLGLTVPVIVSSSVVFENIFSIPGLGRLFYLAVFQRDYPVVMGVLVLGSVLTLIGNFLADIGCALADPRARAGLTR